MGVTKETFSATVTNNEDPDQRGRIKVACAQLGGDEETELPMWIPPALDWGMFFVPDVGETIDVEAQTSSDEDEVRGQMFLQNAEIRWKGTRYYTDDIPKNPNTQATPIHPNFKTNYGKRRGFSTPYGHVLMFDDSPDSPGIQLTWAKNALTPGTPPLAATLSRLGFEGDGSFKLTLLDKQVLHFKAEDDKLVIEINKGEGMTLEGKDADTTVKFGSGGVHAAIAEHLKTYVDNVVKATIDALTVPTGMGPSGTPLNAPMDGYDDAITSNKVEFPDN